MKAVTRTRAVGGSLMVTIPKELVKEEGLTEGVLIEIEVIKPNKKESFFGALKGIGPFTKKDEIDAHE